MNVNATLDAWLEGFELVFAFELAALDDENLEIRRRKRQELHDLLQLTSRHVIMHSLYCYYKVRDTWPPKMNHGQCQYLLSELSLTSNRQDQDSCIAALARKQRIVYNYPQSQDTDGGPYSYVPHVRDLSWWATAWTSEYAIRSLLYAFNDKVNEIQPWSFPLKSQPMHWSLALQINPLIKPSAVLKTLNLLVACAGELPVRQARMMGAMHLGRQVEDCVIYLSDITTLNAKKIQKIVRVLTQGPAGASLCGERGPIGMSRLASGVFLGWSPMPNTAVDTPLGSAIDTQENELANSLTKPTTFNSEDYGHAWTNAIDHCLRSLMQGTDAIALKDNFKQSFKQYFWQRYLGIPKAEVLGYETMVNDIIQINHTTPSKVHDHFHHA